MIKNITKFLIPLSIIIVGLAIAGGLYQIGKKEIPGALSPEDASEKAINFINAVALNGQTVASLSEITEESGLYKISINIENEEYMFYISKDGKILFPQGTEIPEEIPASNTSEGLEESEFLKTDIPQIQLFVMSFCSYGNQAEELMIPVAELLKDKADIELHYVIYSDYANSLRAQGYDAPAEDYCFSQDEKYCSMHGIQELNQDIRELCVQKYQKDKLWDFIKAINNDCNYQDVDSCWENTAKKLGMNTTEIKTCQKNESLSILAQEAELNKKYGVNGSPQLIINEVEYTGARTSEAYKEGICSAFTSAPKECSQSLNSTGESASGSCE